MARHRPAQRCRRFLRKDCTAPLAALALAVLATAAGLALGNSAFAAPARERQQKARAKQKAAVDVKRKAAAAREEEFLSSFRRGLGAGVDPLALADAMVGLKSPPQSEQRRLLTGDWRLCDSDPGDVLVQFGSGLHGLPFVEMRSLFLSLRANTKQMRAVEVLSVGPAPKVTTVLKGTVQVDKDNLDLEFTGMVDKDGRDTKQERKGESRSLSTQPLFVGQRVLVLKIAPTADRKGGFAIFEREANPSAAVKEATGEDVSLLPGGR